MEIIRTIFLLIFLTPLLFVPPACCGNILAIFQYYGFSHFKVFLPVLQTLAQRGHNVTVISHVKNPKPHPNYKELLLTGLPQTDAVAFSDIHIGRSFDILYEEFHFLHEGGQKSCKILFESKHVETVLAEHTKRPYDIVLTEYFNTDCQVGIPYLMDVPVVAFSSCALMPWHYDRISLPDTPSYVQSEFIGFPEKLNIWERLTNFIQSRVLKLLYYYRTNAKDNRLIKKYLKIDVDIYEEVKRLTSVLFVNQHYSLSGSRPLTPQLIEVGGLHIDASQANIPLPKEIDDFLNKFEPQKDVILISFGSMLRPSTFDQKKLNATLKVLQERNMKVIWKWEMKDPPSVKSKRIIFPKWLPQLSLLCHPKVKYFWGHAGLLGTTEALHCAKPLILTPIYGDQYANANSVQNRKIGLILDYNTINERTVNNTLNEIQRPRYTSNVQALSKIFRHRDVKPLDKTVWTIEHLIKHNKLATELLQSKAMHMNFFVYHSFDSMLLIVAGLIAVAALAYKAFKYFKQKRQNQPDKNAKKRR